MIAVKEFFWCLFGAFATLEAFLLPFGLFMLLVLWQSTLINCLLGSFFLLLSFSGNASFKDDPNYLGSKVCAGCHADQYKLWKGSHHDWAMKAASEQSVLGNFDNVSFEHYGEKTEFTRSGEQYLVKTRNSAGEMQTFKVAYTFGFYPLQQYLIPFPDGRFQALSVAWDSRPLSEGGQRWFHLYPDEAIPPDDVLHWTGPYFTWNTRCADCHSTNLKRNYQAGSNGYKSTWSEVNVGCEACHGPGLKHVEQAQMLGSAAPGGLNSVSAVGQWMHTQEADTAKYSAASLAARAQGEEQVAMCGSCHSRRAVIGDLNKPGDFHDQHKLQLLEPGLYHADGQIQDEVYVLGSFLQSKMYHKGVVCSNCHEPHSLNLRAEGNGVCAQCHKPQVFDRKEHHHHAEGAGSQCVNCHMPETTYMVVDPRRDHSIRIPRPDLSHSTGAPNACVRCHEKQDNQWATTALASWLDTSGKELPRHYGEAFAAARAGKPGGDVELMRLVMNSASPALVRASALVQLPLSPEAILTAQTQLSDASPLLRRAAIQRLEVLPMEQRLEDLWPLLNDPILSVRTEAARVLAGESSLPTEKRATLDKVVSEYRTVLMEYEGTASGQLNLGGLALDLGRSAEAEQAYQRALFLDPQNIGTRLNLADLYRRQKKDAAGELLLREANEIAPAAAGPWHALGLLLVREKRYEQALKMLKKAADLAPENTRYAYTYGVAANSLGDVASSLVALERVVQREPRNVDALSSLVDIYYRQGEVVKTLKHAEVLLQLTPENRQLQQLVAYLRSSGRQ